MNVVYNCIFSELCNKNKCSNSDKHRGNPNFYEKEIAIMYLRNCYYKILRGFERQQYYLTVFKLIAASLNTKCCLSLKANVSFFRPWSLELNLKLVNLGGQESRKRSGACMPFPSKFPFHSAKIFKNSLLKASLNMGKNFDCFLFHKILMISL